MPNDIEDRIRKGQYEDIYRSRVVAGTKSAQTMTPEEIVAEITSLRETMHLASQRVIDLSRALYVHVRRLGSNGTTPAYLAYANGWMRLAGAVQQGLRRTATTDRILSRAQRELEPHPPQPVQPKAKKEAVVAPASRPNPLHNENPLQAEGTALEELIRLYGSEIVRGARG